MENENISDVIESQPEGCTALITPKKQEIIYTSICSLLHNSGMTISQLSRVTYISERTLTRYFNGKTKDPHFYTLCTIIVALGGDVNEILGVSTNKMEPANHAVNPYGQLIESYRNEAQTLHSSLETLTKNLDTLTKKILFSHKIIFAFAVALIAVIAVFCTLEIVDISNPNWGRYQWALDLYNSFLSLV